jgi:hypothetical protein
MILVFTVVLIFSGFVNCNCIQLDLLKAFHYVEQDTLMDKLCKYGVLGIPQS